MSDKATNTDYRLDYVLREGDAPPVIIEVMTASTSGGNKNKRTDMQSAFSDATLHVYGLRPDNAESPGVNARQVWARMASQMIVKSEVANAWGGCCIWVVQDTLIEYINSRTGLQMDALKSSDWTRGEVNVISANINDPADLNLYAGPIRSVNGEPCWSDLLRAPAIPSVGVLAQRLDPGRAVAVIV